MDLTFLTIHNLSADANILFASDSITDILGYNSQDVLNKSCFDYFHPDEVPFARSVHSRGILLDKAAVLHYARLRSRDGAWISCECCFTIVHDVLVACISVYKRGEKSEKRASDAPQIRRIFSCSPRDPRYHMLQYLSPKFEMPPAQREPRAALILNRFTRSLSVMFSTNALAEVLGVSPGEIQDKSFYECIQDNCLDDAVKCLESAKANDSIAYLRFWSRDPRREEDLEDEESEEDDEIDEVKEEHERDDHGSAIKQESPMNGMTDDIYGHHHRDSHSDSDSGGVRLDVEMDLDVASPKVKEEEESGSMTGLPQAQNPSRAHDQPSGLNGPASHQGLNGDSATRNRLSQEDRPLTNGARRARRAPYPIPSVELEAVVSCTSDGLVVILRKARPMAPTMSRPSSSVRSQNGIFAAPWGQQPIRPHNHAEMYNGHHSTYQAQYMPDQAMARVPNGPPPDQLMDSIREIAVFAWAVVGINGNLASYSRGQPRSEAQPPQGLPIWNPQVAATPDQGPDNQALRWWAMAQNRTGMPGPPTFGHRMPYSTNYPSEVPRNPSMTNGYGDYAFGQQAWAPNQHQLNGQLLSLRYDQQDPRSGMANSMTNGMTNVVNHGSYTNGFHDGTQAGGGWHSHQMPHANGINHGGSMPHGSPNGWHNGYQHQWP